MERIEQAIGTRKYDTSITKDNKAIGPITLVRRKVVEETLTSKMVQLGFVVIDDSWSYDPDGCLSKRKNVMRHKPQNLWIECTNPWVDDPSKYVGPDNFSILERPSWLKFYSLVQRFNPAKHIPQALLENMKTLSWSRKKREDFWVYHQEVNQIRVSLGNVSLDECFEQEWGKVNKSDDEIGDSSSRRDLSPKVAAQQEFGIINIEG